MTVEVWTEKYRPDRLEDVVNHEHIISRLKAFVEDENIPHLLFSGPAGTGKCMTYETPVITVERGIVPIGEIVEDLAEDEGFTQTDNLNVFSLDSDGKITTRETQEVFKRSTEKVIEIETSHGSKKKVTAEHPFLGIEDGLPEWKTAKELEEDDFIAIPDRIDFEGEKYPLLKEIDRERFRVILPEKYEAPVSEKYSGKRKGIIRAIERGAESLQDLYELDMNRKNIRSHLSDLEAEGIISRGPGLQTTKENDKNMASLSYCEEEDIPPEEFKKIVYVSRFGAVSGEIEPVREVTPELFELVGYILAEGSLKSSDIRFYNTNEKILEHFTELSEEIFGVKPERSKEREVALLRFKNGGTIAKFLGEIFDLPLGEKKKSSKIYLTKHITSAPSEAVSGFLRSYSDAEGYVSRQGIEITTASERMASGLTYLFSRLGINARMKEEEKSATNGSRKVNTYYTLLISGRRDLNRFRERVGFRVDHKREGLDELCRQEHNPNIDILENCADTYREIMDSLGIEYGRVFTERSDWMLESSTETVGRITHSKMMGKLLKYSRRKLKRLIDIREELKGMEDNFLALSGFESRYREIENGLTPLERRKRIQEKTGIRYDRLLEYGQGKRTPETGRIHEIVSTGQVPVSKRTKGILEKIDNYQKALQRAVRESRLDYSEIGRKLGIGGSSVQTVLTGDVSVGKVRRLAEIYATVRSDIEKILKNEGLYRSLTRLEFMVDSDIRWTRIDSIDEGRNKTVYDLTVPGVHNFVAGRTPTLVHNTASALSIAQELFGEGWKENLLELNASDMRGIDVIRNQVKDFARSKSIGDVPFKMIILDEADALTPEAQQALRRTMENYTETCRFCLICNYSSKIIDPIRSRCSIFRFPRLDEEDAMGLLEKISEGENVEYEKDGLDAIISISRGDLRKAINLLQSVAAVKEKVTEEMVYDVSTQAKPDVVKEVLKSAVDGNFEDARDRLQELLLEKGIAGTDIIKEIHRQLYDLDIPEKKKVRVVKKMGEHEFRIDEGANEQIQLEALLAEFAS